MLKKTSDAKYTMLKEQKAQFEARLKAMDEFYAQTQIMMKDPDFDPDKRKLKILNEGKELLGTEEVVVTPVTNDKIVLWTDVDAVTDLCTYTSAVIDGHGPLPPTIEIKCVSISATARSVTLTIKEHPDGKDCTEFKTKYGPAVEDEKTWKG